MSLMNYFKLESNKTTLGREMLAGFTTFLAMAYILAVNPSYLGGIPGASNAAIFMATALSAAIATICMAFFANYPVALASGMGLNAFFAFTVCGTMGYSFEQSMVLVLIAYLLLSTNKKRCKKLF